MKGNIGTTRPYRKRSVNKPIPTVLTMKRVLDLHLRPIGLDLAMIWQLDEENVLFSNERKKGHSSADEIL